MKQTFKFNSSFVLLLQISLYNLLLTISMIDSKSPTITDVDIKLTTVSIYLYLSLLLIKIKKF